MSGLKNKIVVITGASSGIGKALAFEFAKKGSQLILASKSFEEVKSVALAIKERFPEIISPIPFNCDIKNEDEVKELFDYCDKNTKGIDILVNNAGICVYGEGLKIPMEEYRSIMEVNFFGTLRCMLEAIPIMKKIKKGTIVNIASLAAIHGVPYLGAYGASKAALENVSQSLQAEVSKDGVKIMMVYPGYTQTEIFEKENIYGDVHRPKKGYAPAEKVAKKIVRSIEKERNRLIFTFEGKMLAFIESIIPSIARKAMKKLAIKLKN